MPFPPSLSSTRGLPSLTTTPRLGMTDAERFAQFAQGQGAQIPKSDATTPVPASQSGGPTEGEAFARFARGTQSQTAKVAVPVTVFRPNTAPFVNARADVASTPTRRTDRDWLHRDRRPAPAPVDVVDNTPPTTGGGTPQPGTEPPVIDDQNGPPGSLQLSDEFLATHYYDAVTRSWVERPNTGTSSADTSGGGGGGGSGTPSVIVLPTGATTTPATPAASSPGRTIALGIAVPVGAFVVIEGIKGLAGWMQRRREEKRTGNPRKPKAKKKGARR